MGDTENTPVDTTVTDTQPDKTGNTSGTTEAKFTQADLDRIAGDTRKAAKQAAINDLLKELGFEKADDLKALVTADKKRREDEMTEVQKAAAEKEKVEARALKAETDLENERNARRADLRDGKVKDALVASNAKADKVLKLLKVDKAAELDALLKEDGTVDEGKLKTLVEDAKKAYPEDFSSGRGFSSNPGSPSIGGGKPLSQRDQVDKALGSKSTVRL